jgi:hypothetical protein
MRVRAVVALRPWTTAHGAPDEPDARLPTVPTGPATTRSFFLFGKGEEMRRPPPVQPRAYPSSQLPITSEVDREERSEKRRPPPVQSRAYPSSQLPSTSEVDRSCTSASGQVACPRSRAWPLEAEHDQLLVGGRGRRPGSGAHRGSRVRRVSAGMASTAALTWAPRRESRADQRFMTTRSWAPCTHDPA